MRFTLSAAMPIAITKQVDAELRDIKAKATDYFTKQIEAYERTLDKIAEARESMAILRSQLPEHRKRVDKMREGVKSSIEASRASSLTFVRTEISRSTTAEEVEIFIRQNFSRKQDAKQDALVRLLETKQSKLEDFLKTQSEKLKEIVEEFLSEYEATLSKQGATEYGGFEVPFDVQGAFVGGLAGIGMLGALRAC